MTKVILSTDSTCDLDDTLVERYNVQIQPLHITMGETFYRDGIDITPDDIYATYESDKILPQTAAPNPQEYIDHFQKWTDQGYEVVHINLGSGISSSHQNAKIAASTLPNVYAVDSGNLSTGMGHLVIEAGERILQGKDGQTIAEEVTSLKDKVCASFIIDKLTYLHAGGRCSALTALSASVLNIKPRIDVNPTDASMTVGKKYRGSLEKSLKKYVKDHLSERDDICQDKIFITHSGTSDEIIQLVKDEVEKHIKFDEVFITRAGCTISSHCGPNTVGILFMTN
ncbi:MAG TPA: DegV family protein [Pseudogracilibacillus sp.]|nr:DegV family protein [Pseudogracilibacillus sp.]